MTRLAVNGIHLNVEDRGSGPALMLLHGFTGRGANWDDHVAAFAAFRTVTVDIIGHGDSDAPADPARYTVEHCVDDLKSVLDLLRIDRVALLGYSMGGRIALRFAVEAPERLWALVLESASPGIEDVNERVARVQSDEALAADIERFGIEAFVDRWEALPLFSSQKRLPPEIRARHRAQRLANRPLGLANSLRGMGAGAQEPLQGRLSRVLAPTLIIAGALDPKYRALAHQMAEAIPSATYRIVGDAGHATHLEQPGSFQSAVSSFLPTCLPRLRHQNKEVSR